jgi:hypothetical protein
VTDPALPSFVAASTRYITALYFVAWSLLCVGMGDMKAITQSERVLATVIMFTGGIVLALTIGGFTSLSQFLTADVDAKAAAARDLQQWMIKRALPDALRVKVTLAVSAAADAPSRLAGELQDGASPALQEALAEALYAPLARSIPLLSDVLAAHPPSAWRLAAALRPTSVAAEDVLLREGDAAEQVLLLIEGRADLLCRDPRAEAAGDAAEPFALVDGAAPEFAVGQCGRGGVVGLHAVMRANDG